MLNSALSSVLLVGLAGIAFADEPSYLCNKTSADANGTFFYSYNPHVDQGPQSGQINTSGQTLDVGVGLTLVQNPDTDKVEYSLWYDTNGANYTDDAALGYDVCAVSWSPTPLSTQIRGQESNGTCYKMFDRECISAIESQAAQSALQFYNSVNGNSSSGASVASPPSLICGDIATSLNNNLPEACKQYVNSSTSFAPAIPITGQGSAVYAFNCDLEGMMNGTQSTYHLFQTKTAPFSKQAYANYADYAWPLLAIWMPYSGNSQYTIHNASAGMICGRITNYTQDSYIPAPLSSSISSTSPTSTASSSSSNTNNSLSGGAIAGIVIGAVVGVALLTGLLALLLIHKRRKAKTSTEDQIFEKDGGDTLHEVASGGELTSVKTIGTLSEAPDTAIVEADGEATWAKRQELNADREQEIFELPGEEQAETVRPRQGERDDFDFGSDSWDTEMSEETLGTGRGR